jgi:hypothetical protein
MKTNYIKTTLTFKFLCEEAIEMSFKYIHDIFYIIQRGNTLYITSIKEDGVILAAYQCGGKLFNY